MRSMRLSFKLILCVDVLLRPSVDNRMTPTAAWSAANVWWLQRSAASPANAEVAQRHVSILVFAERKQPQVARLVLGELTKIHAAARP